MKIRKLLMIVLSIVILPFTICAFILRIVFDLVAIASLFLYTATFNKEVEYESYVFNKLFGT